MPKWPKLQQTPAPLGVISEIFVSLVLRKIHNLVEIQLQNFKSCMLWGELIPLSLGFGIITFTIYFHTNRLNKSSIIKDCEDQEYN